jgi:UDP-N-acetyl-D-glucosamine dehydrogenase
MLPSRVDKRTKLKISVIGLGSEGLKLALALAKMGANVVGWDSDSSRIEVLERSMSYAKEIPHWEIQEVVDRHKIVFGSDIRQIARSDLIVVTHLIPANGHNQPELCYFANLLKRVCPHLGKGTIVAIVKQKYLRDAVRTAQNVLQAYSANA